MVTIGVRRLGIEDQHLAAPQLEAVAAPARITTVDLLVGDGQPERAQPSQVQAQERWAVEAGENEGREWLRPRHRDERAAPHAGPRPGPETAERDDRPRQHAQAGGFADATGHRDQAAPEAGTVLRARVAVDDDLAAAHARPLAGT